MTIHNFSEKQLKMFAAYTSKPCIAVPVTLWRDNDEDGTREYTLDNGTVIELPQGKGFLYAKKHLLYLQLSADDDYGKIAMEVASRIMEEFLE